MNIRGSDRLIRDIDEFNDYSKYGKSRAALYNPIIESEVFPECHPCAEGKCIGEACCYADGCSGLHAFGEKLVIR